jgi:hypothetical protein
MVVLGALDVVVDGAGTGGVAVAHPTMISTIIMAIRRLLLAVPFLFKCRSRAHTFTDGGLTRNRREGPSTIIVEGWRVIGKG